jgi:uncharacterized protein with beta-barrel porin domain
MFASPACAQVANLTGANVNAINLLAPFLSLNSTAIGQQTLQTNLSQAVAINQNAASVALLNNYYSTATLGALAISDENSLGTASTTLYGTTTKVGVAANLAGALPTQNTTAYGTLYNGSQQYGAFGSVLGAAYVNAVNPSNPKLPNTIALLTTAFNFTGNSLSTGDSQVAKFYFANGTWNGTTTAVAPAGYTLPTFALSSPSTTLPNTTNSVYDIAYGVTNTQAGQNAYGDSHPYQTYPDIPGASYTLYDPTVKTATTVGGAINPDKPSSNPAFPSSHMAYAMTDALLLGMLAPQFYQSMLVRASEIGESRIVVGVHYPTDIIASRAYISYDLAQYLSNPSYINNAAVTGTAVNLPALFTASQGEMQTVLGQVAVNAGCGTSFATCATSSTNVNPYAPSSTNAQVYEARLTYGLPTLTFAQAAREAAPAGGPDASILLATLYGGSTGAAQKLAPTGGIYGNLSTNTINQIIVNTETNALAAYYGTSLSYWARINLYAAAGYFGGVTGTITLASGDQVNTNVVVAGATTNVNGDVVPAGVLAGSGGITGNVMVNSGGTFAPGTSGVPATMAVTGNLAFQSGAVYLVQLNPTSSSLAQVTGAATLGGASVGASYTNGSYVAKQYTILTATGGVSGTFNSLVNTNLPAGFVSSLSYDPNNVYLNLAINYGAVPGLGVNQQNVGNALGKSFSSNGSIPVVFGGLTPAGLTQASGEAASGSQQSTFNAMTQFMGLMTDPSIGGRGGSTGDSGVTSYAEEDRANAYTAAARKSSATDAYAMFTKAPLARTYDPRWSVWASGFGGSQTTDGNAAAGTNATTSRIVGTAVGADYRFSPSTLAGFALAGGGTNFLIANGLGSGRSDLFQAGAFIRHAEGAAYITGALAYAWQDVTTNRTVTIAGVNQLSAEFNANAWSGRVEGGYRFVAPWVGGIGITPYAAVQFTTFDLPAYAEQAVVGSSVFALAYGSRTVTDSRSEIGIRTDKSFALSDAILTLGGRAAWAHDYNPDRTVAATFQALPGASFVVNGAAQASDSALVTASAEMKWTNRWSVAATFEGEFSSVTASYAGKGVARYTW